MNVGDLVRFKSHVNPLGIGEKGLIIEKRENNKVVVLTCHGFRHVVAPESLEVLSASR